LKSSLIKVKLLYSYIKYLKLYTDLFTGSKIPVGRICSIESSHYFILVQF